MPAPTTHKLMKTLANCRVTAWKPFPAQPPVPETKTYAIKTEISRLPSQQRQVPRPKTPETKERSSRNSLRHGIVARKTILLECEDPNQFQDMLNEYAETYQPGNAVEQDLVDEMLSSRWRSGRLSMIVTSLLDMQMNQQRLQTAPPATTRPDPARPIATAFKSLADESKALALALRTKPVSAASSNAPSPRSASCSVKEKWNRPNRSR